MTYSKKEKSRIFREYYQKLVNKFYGLFVLFDLPDKFCLASFVWCFLHSAIWYFIGFFFLVNEHGSTQFGSGISQSVKDANKVSMTKNIFGNNRIETTRTAEKTSFKGNNVDVRSNFGYFKQQPCDFGINKENTLENSIIYISQGYQSIL